MDNMRLQTKSSDSVPDEGKRAAVDEPLKSVFSTVVHIKVGTGTTARRQETRVLWYVEQRTADEYAVRKINPSFVPVGDETVIGREELLSDYSPEVEIHNSQVQPAIVSLKKTIGRGDRHREDGQLLSAEMEYSSALEIDETNVRATFGLGLVYLERQDQEKARVVFEELVGMQGAFNGEHKHLFNEFGISLRKSNLFKEAVRYYSRAVELEKTDENLFYNLARAHYENGDWEGCVENLARALNIFPSHEYALSLCHHVVVIADNETKRKRLDKPAVPDPVYSRAKELVGSWKPVAGKAAQSGGGMQDLELGDL